LEQKLCNAWHGSMTAAEIVAEFKVGSESALYRIWRHLRAVGKLPKGARPYFVIESGAMIEKKNSASSLDCDFECSESTIEQSGVSIPANDPLLAALQRVHSNDRRRDFDGLVFDDRKITPAPAQCLAQIRFRDRVMQKIAGALR